MTTETLSITLEARRDQRARGGHPWIYSNEIRMTPEAKAARPGTLAMFRDVAGKPLAQGFFNPKSLIAGRILTRNADRAINRAFLTERLEQALALRRKLGLDPFCRLVHAEADRLPGLIIDRLGDVVVIEANAAGMALLESEIVAAVDGLLNPRAIVLRNDNSVRALEGLDLVVAMAKGQLDQPVEIEENNCLYLTDPHEGQKTGWYYDHRANRAKLAAFAHDASVLDLYCHSGGFGLLAAKAGAKRVVAVDRSKPALALGAAAAKRNGVEAKITFDNAEVYSDLEARLERRERFDIVIADPPPFAKSRKDLEAAAKGYRKLAKLSAGLVAPTGLLFIASCSHNMPADRFLDEVQRGLGQAGRSARVLEQAGAAMDHPLHPLLPESAYLKSLLLALD